MCAEGGTDRGHSEVIFRSKTPWGPYEAWQGNPILTQRDLPANREHPVTNAGHADLVQMQDGSWWAVFLASRPYRDYLFNTGRETWLLPVTWKDGWPVILEPGKSIPYSLKAPKVMSKDADAGADALAGNFTRRDEFDAAEPGPEWLQIHVPRQRWYELLNGNLVIQPSPVNLDAKRNTSFYARRQAHLRFAASTALAPPRARAPPPASPHTRTRTTGISSARAAPRSGSSCSSSAMRAPSCAWSRSSPSRLPIRSS
jgi:alpha-N-arabinofuranosidase